jgi:hypothetical protein
VFATDKCNNNPMCDVVASEVAKHIKQNLEEVTTNKAIEDSPQFRKNVFYQLIEKFMDQYREALRQYDYKKTDTSSIIYKIIQASDARP